MIEEASMKRLRKKLYPCFHQWSIAHAGVKTGYNRGELVF